MKLSSRFLVVAAFFMISPVYSSDHQDDESARSGLTGHLIRTATGMLDLVCAPLAYFSIPDEGARLFNVANELLERDELNSAQLQQAHEHLSRSAVEGHAPALFHMGALMIGLPDERYQPLVPYVTFDEKLGVAYLEEAQRQKVAGVSEVLHHLRCLKLLNESITIAYGLNEDPDLEAAQALLMQAIELGSPHTAFYLAEALIKPTRCSHPWMNMDKLSLYARRTKGLPLLDVALKADLQVARALRAELIREDEIYGAVCNEIYNNANTRLNGLVLGDAGFQETYIDMLCQTKKLMNGRVLTPALAYFLKEAMSKRVGLVFSYLTDYSQYVNKCNSSSRHVSRAVKPSEALSLMVNFLVGKYEIRLPAIIGDDNKTIQGEIFYSFRDGLLYPVTLLDANTAYRQLIEASDDFARPLSPEPVEELSTQPATQALLALQPFIFDEEIGQSSLHSKL